MVSGALLCLLTGLLAAVDVVVGIEPAVPIAQSQPLSQGGCFKYLVTGKGDFKIEKKRYPTQKTDYYIAHLELKERTGFYKCTPEEVKYGVDMDGKTWWVDKGCEGIFEVRECRDEAAKLKSAPISDWESTMYAKFLKIHDKPVAINNLHEWRILSTSEKRFDHPALLIKKP